LEILTARTLRTANGRQHAKFRADRLNRYKNMAVFGFSWICKVGNFNCPYPSRASVRHHAKFCAYRSSRCGDRAVFLFFKMAAVRHIEFLKVGNFNCPYHSKGRRANVRHPANDDRRQIVSLVWHSYTMCTRASNKSMPSTIRKLLV